MSDKVLYTVLFSTGSARDPAADEAEVRRLAAEKFEGFSIFRGQGYWRDKEELSFQILLVAEDQAAVSGLVKKIKSTFRQDTAIVIRHNTATAEFR